MQVLVARPFDEEEESLMALNRATLPPNFHDGYENWHFEVRSAPNGKQATYTSSHPFTGIHHQR